jgi:hypothetical protein
VKALQAWLSRGRRRVFLGFRLGSRRYSCTLTDVQAVRSHSAEADTLERCVELALERAKAAGVG